MQVINKTFQIPKCNSESASIRYGSDFYTLTFIGHWAMLLVVRNQAGAVPCASFSLTIVDGRGFRCSFQHKVSDIFFNRSREHT